jgi:hypothetical protein
LCSGCFGDGVSWTICSAWPWTVILLIIASQVARITGVSHWYLLLFAFLNLQLQAMWRGNQRGWGWKQKTRCLLKSEAMRINLQHEDDKYMKVGEWFYKWCCQFRDQWDYRRMKDRTEPCDVI